MNLCRYLDINAIVFTLQGDIGYGVLHCYGSDLLAALMSFISNHLFYASSRFIFVIIAEGTVLG